MPSLVVSPSKLTVGQICMQANVFGGGSKPKISRIWGGIGKMMKVHLSAFCRDVR